MDLKIIWISILILALVDFLHWKKYKIREWIDRQNLFFRWSIYLGAIFVVLIIGLYGGKYDAANFIYSEF